MTWGQIKRSGPAYTRILISNPSSWTIAIKLLTKSPQDPTHSFEGTAYCFPLCWAKQQCYSFLLHPNLYLWFQFSTSAQRLNFQHQYADGHSPIPPTSILSFYPQGHRNGIELAFLLPVLPDILSSHCSQSDLSARHTSSCYFLPAILQDSSVSAFSLSSPVPIPCISALIFCHPQQELPKP